MHHLRLRVATCLGALAASVTLAVSASGAGHWLPIDDGAKSPVAPEVLVRAADLSGVDVDVSLEGVSLELRETRAGAFVEVTWPGAAVYGDVGSPALPVIRKLVGVPDGAAIDLRVDEGQPVFIDLARQGLAAQVMPVQPPIEKVPGARDRAKFAYDLGAYQGDILRPQEPATITDIGVVRGQHLFLLEVRPIAYNAARGELAMWPDMRVSVDFRGGKKSAGEGPMASLGETLLNPMPPARADRDNNYLIVVAEQFAEAINTFANFKSGQGYDVMIHECAPGETNTQIKSYISGLWGTPDAPDYLLLVGDTNTIPAWTGQGTGSPTTDIQYACMDGGDEYLPDIAFGRFPVRTVQQLEDVMEKIMDLESGNWGDPTYAERACFMASVDNHEISEGTHNYVVDTYMIPNGIECDLLYQVTHGADTQDVRDSFNEGQVYGIYSGHGGVYSWADGPPFSQSDVNNLTNHQMYPLVMSFACVTGTYDVDECFCETWIRTPDSGAAAIYGSSVNSYWTEDDILERVVFDQIYDDPPTREVSPAWQGGMLRYLTHFGESGMTRRYFEMYNLLGDPSMWIPEPGGGADLRVMPTGDLVAEGMVGGPFDPESITYNLGNNADVALDFSVSCDADWIEIDTTGGTIPVGGEIPVTVSFSATAESLPQGTYEADVEFLNLTTGDGDCLRHVTLHIGRTIIAVDPGHGFETGGPIGGPFTGEQTYTITSQRPTPVDVQVSCDVDWLAVNGSTEPFNATLVGVGDSVEALVSISDLAESMEAGVYTGHVNFVNMTSGEGNTSREIILEVGRVVYAATDVPQPIDDYQVITSTIDVGDFYCVGDVNVDIDVTHTYIGDLSIDLIAPSGVTVRLHDRTGGSDEDIVTTYDEQGGTMPDGPGSLTDFSYAGVNGTWSLRIEDHAGGDQGSLNAWALRIVPLGDTCPPVAYDMDITVPAVTPSEIELDGESIEGEPLDYTIVSLPTYATLADPNGGVIDTVPYTLLNGGNVVGIDPDNDYVGLDLFEFRVFDGQDSNVASVDVMIGGPQPVHVFDFETDPGWETEGEWAFGQPTGGGTHNGDPLSGHTGNNVYGYNLAGDYPNNMPERDLTTTAIDCSDMTEVEVRFWRWLGVESSTWDHAKFQVSTNGSNWTTIWEHSGSSIGDTAWVAQAFDISAVADNQPTVYLKWVMGTTDGSVTYPGWNVDDVELWGIQPIEICPGDLDGDGMVGVEDLLILLAAWGDPGGDADLNGDGLVEVSDLLILLAGWGACP